MSSNTPVHLAVDLGASSGRVIASWVDDGKLQLEPVHRFANDPVRVQQTLLWDWLGLWREIQQGLRMASNQYDNIASVGVDTWGVSYVMLDGQDNVTSPVRHYRDAIGRGMIEKAFETVPREELFAATGIQFIEINSIYFLIATRMANEPALEIAEDFLMMGDLFHWLLTGKKGVELTNASTTQLLDPRTKQWSSELIERFGLPERVFGQLVEPGTILGNVQDSVVTTTGLKDVPVVVPATHDTASAVIATPAKDFAPAEPNWCYISSGTWSLMGCELPEPKINGLCSELNFTNEGGVSGSIRLLKNIGGLWIFQQIRHALERRGEAESWDAMVEGARKAKPFELLLDPDDPAFVAPDDMVDAISEYASRTGQGAPTNNNMIYRAALEGLAMRYRVCLGMLESLVGHTIETIHIVGGGSQNELLCQMTADACNRVVVAGPVEATAIGNVLMQMIGTGHLSSIEEARALVRESFDTKSFEPTNASDWDVPAERFAALA
tara:strand:- start:195672 stop:197162 length:1491 start_codon:yes stop_codon:yes gene_type:complete